MSKIKFDQDSMKIISIFETLTGANLKDLIMAERPIFIVNEGDVGKAIGKKGSNIKKIEQLLKKKVRIVEFNDNVEVFVKNMLLPLKVESIEINDKELLIHGPDTKTKGLIIGRDRQNLKNLTEIVKRYFDIEEIKVV